MTNNISSRKLVVLRTNLKLLLQSEGVYQDDAHIYYELKDINISVNPNYTTIHRGGTIIGGENDGRD